MPEHFKVVKRTKRTLYEISNLGTVKVNGRIVPQDTLCKVSGYRYMSSIGGYIHRVVAKHFLGEPESKDLVVSFKDGNRENITVNNLEWTTYKVANSRVTSKPHYRGKNAQVNPLAYYKPTTPVEEALLNLWCKHNLSTHAISELTGMAADKVKKIIDDHRRDVPFSQDEEHCSKYEIKYSIENFHNPRRKIHREIIRLRTEEGMTYEDTASKLGVPLQVVKNTINRFRIREGEERIDYEALKKASQLRKHPKTQRQRTIKIEEKWSYAFPEHDLHYNIIKLRKVHGYNYEDIADEFKISKAYVNGVLAKYRIPKNEH